MRSQLLFGVGLWVSNLRDTWSKVFGYLNQMSQSNDNYFRRLSWYIIWSIINEYFVTN